jgi:hypothetical protein
MLLHLQLWKCYFLGHSEGLRRPLISVDVGASESVSKNSSAILTDATFRFSAYHSAGTWGRRVLKIDLQYALTRQVDRHSRASCSLLSIIERMAGR